MAPAGVVAHSIPPAGVARWTSDPEVDAGCCSHLEFCALFQWAVYLVFICYYGRWPSRVCRPRSTLRSLWKVLRLRTHRFHRRHQRLALLPGLRLSGHLHASSRSPSRTKRPVVLLRPRGDGSPAVTGAPPGSLSARCVSC